MEIEFWFPSAASQQGKRSSVATTTSDSCTDISHMWSSAPDWSGKLQAEAGVGVVSCQVEYQCDGFVEKNRDAVPEELVGLL